MPSFFRDPDPVNVDIETLARAVDGDEAAVVDVREPYEFAAGHIPGAVSQPLSSFDPGDLPTGKPVILICQAGARSRKALDRVHAAGRSDVRHYPGGMSQWRARGGAVEV